MRNLLNKAPTRDEKGMWMDMIIFDTEYENIKYSNYINYDQLITMNYN